MFCLPRVTAGICFLRMAPIVVVAFGAAGSAVAHLFECLCGVELLWIGTELRSCEGLDLFGCQTLNSVVVFGIFGHYANLWVNKYFCRVKLK